MHFSGIYPDARELMPDATIEESCRSRLALHCHRDFARHLHSTVATAALFGTSQVGVHRMPADIERQGYLMIAFALTI